MKNQDNPDTPKRTSRHTEDVEMYETICKDRFAGIDRRLDKIAEVTEESHAVLVNGLKSRVASHSKILWTMLALLLGIFIQQIVVNYF